MAITGKGECVLEECEQPRHKKGLCSSHYYRERRHGDPRRGGTARHKDLRERLAANSEEDGECLVWTAGRFSTGYGYTRRGDGSRTHVHRVAYELEHGPIPEGMVVDHICHNRACFRVSHLRLATQQQNVQHLSSARSHNRSTGYRNIQPTGSRFRVRVIKDGVPHCQTVDTLDEAIVVAAELREELFGEFAGTGGRFGGNNAETA